MNLPLPAGATGDVYLRALDEVVAPQVERFAPTWVLISAGFDAHRADPLTGLGLSAGDYAAISERVAEWAEPGRLISFLEGGYDLEALRDSVAASLPTLIGAPSAAIEGEKDTSGGPGTTVVEAVADLWRRRDDGLSPISPTTSSSGPRRAGRYPRRRHPDENPVLKGTTLLDLDNLLRESVRLEASDVHIKVGSPPYLRVDGHLQPWDSEPVTPADTERIAFALLPKARADEFLDHHEADFAYTLAGTRPLPGQRLPPARIGRPRPAARAARHPVDGGARPAADRASPRRGAAWPRARHRPDRLGQDHDARRDDRPHQRAPGAPHRDRRGPDRGAAPRQALDREPARDRYRHRRLPQRAQARAAPGPRRDPHRRDARPGDRVGRAVGRRDRAPRPLDAAHDGRGRDDHPHHRLLPAVPAAAGADVGGDLAEGDRLAAARRTGRPPGPRSRDGGPRQHRVASSTRSPTPSRPTSSTRSSPTASSTACRPSTRVCGTSTSRAS